MMSGGWWRISSVMTLLALGVAAHAAEPLREEFAYAIPLDNGRYQVTLGFIEPDTGTASGGRVFTVLANGKPQLQGFDVLAAANGDHERAVTRRFAVDVTNGRLQLDFLPSQGEAVVSSISIRRQ